jgi:hypothetical protein
MTAPKDKKKTDFMDVAILLGIAPLRALFTMLGFGVLHHDWSDRIPALGFWACLLLVLAFTGILRR